MYREKPETSLVITAESGVAPALASEDEKNRAHIESGKRGIFRGGSSLGGLCPGGEKEGSPLVK